MKLKDKFNGRKIEACITGLTTKIRVQLICYIIQLIKDLVML